MRIVIAGATGTAGRRIDAEARRRGHQTIALARSTGVDVVGDAPLEPHLEGADAVVDATNVMTMSDAGARRFFATATRRLLDAEAAVGVGHHVALSIVGIDGATKGYFAAKLMQERLIANGPVPWSVLRATQLHEFAVAIHDTLKLGPLHLAPRMRTQPVGASEVAQRIVDRVEAGPSGMVDQLAGPREERFEAMVRAVGRARGSRWTMPVALPGEYGRMQRDGSLLPSADVDRASQTFDDWLAQAH